MRNRQRLLALLTLPLAASAQNLADGRDVYGPCAACHGANGEGGKGGEYPRIAGQPVSFLVSSLEQFQDRKRMNLPMFPYMEPRELSRQDMRDVAAFVSGITLPTQVPDPKDGDSALDRLLALEKVLIVPRVDGDAKEGKRLYRDRCARCHGKYGHGLAKKQAPRLLGQYPSYLLRQRDAYLRGDRGAGKDDPMQGVFEKLSETQFVGILAWLTSIQDQEAEPEDDAPAAEPTGP